MSSYYCPYCNPRYQFKQEKFDGVLICSQCGEPLVKIPLIKPIRVLALITASAFLIPLLLMLASLFNEPNQKKPSRDLDSMAMCLPTLIAK